METSAAPGQQIRADCTCVRRKTPSTKTPSYPQWKEGEDNAAKLRKHGYFVVRGLLTNQEVEETKQEISRIVSGWYEKQAQKSGGDDGLDWEEIANRCFKRNLSTSQLYTVMYMWQSQLKSDVIPIGFQPLFLYYTLLQLHLEALCKAQHWCAVTSIYTLHVYQTLDFVLKV